MKEIADLREGLFGGSEMTPDGPEWQSKHMLQFRAAQAVQDLFELLETFRERQGPPEMLTRLGGLIARCLVNVNAGLRSYPEFPGWRVMKNDALEVAYALLELHGRRPELDDMVAAVTSS